MHVNRHMAPSIQHGVVIFVLIIININEVIVQSTVSFLLGVCGVGERKWGARVFTAFQGGRSFLVYVQGPRWMPES